LGGYIYEVEIVKKCKVSQFRTQISFKYRELIRGTRE
jgi:hypothetical protein